MENIKSISLVFFGLSLLFFSAVGAIECYNKTVVGSVMRPWVVRYYDPDDVGQIPASEIRNAGRLAQGIPEGRNHK